MNGLNKGRRGGYRGGGLRTPAEILTKHASLASVKLYITLRAKFLVIDFI